MRLTTLAVAKLILKTRPVKSIMEFAETVASHEELRRLFAEEERSPEVFLETKSSSRKDRGGHGLARALLCSDS